MANGSQVTRDEIKNKVIEKLKSISDSDEIIDESTRLEEDLEITKELRGAMALPYSKICKKYGGLVISVDEAQGLKTVGDSIDLVFSRARGQK